MVEKYLKCSIGTEKYETHTHTHTHEKGHTGYSVRRVNMNLMGAQKKEREWGWARSSHT